MRELIYHVCPYRTRQFEIKDFYNDAGQCTTCGSISPTKFFEYIDKGYSVKLDPDERIVYLPELGPDVKLCFNHLNLEEQGMLSECYKIGKFKIMR